MTSLTESQNIIRYHSKVKKRDRELLLNQRGVVIWFTGLSASGKSTIAHAVEKELFKRGHLTYVLDGDNVRYGLNNNLGFSPEDREENVRRVGEVAKLFSDAGLITMTALISPYRKDRQKARELHNVGEFIEVFVDAPLHVLEERDPKGLYKRARAGEIKEYTGISAPYEAPENPEIYLDTSKMTLKECVDKVISYLEKRNIIPSRR